jgi:hypothetical protein
MLTYPAKLLVLSRIGGRVRYALFARGSELTLVAAGSVAEQASLIELLPDAAASLVLYVVTPDEYSRKQISFASRFRLDSDPDQLCWEIERRSVSPFHRFRYNLLPLRGQSGQQAIVSFALSDEKQARIGNYCKSSQLALHRLIFKPIALHNLLRRHVEAEQSVIVVASEGELNLLFYHNHLLVDQRAVSGSLSIADQRSQFVDDLGTLAAAVFSGLRVSQKLELIFAGVADPEHLKERLHTQLPYRLEIKTCLTVDLCQLSTAGDPHEYEEFFDFAVVARNFIESEPCESLPVKDAASR